MSKMEKNQYLTVAALTKYIKRKFDADPNLADIHVKGEISNFKKHSSGHMYLTLKDDKSRINAVMFAKSAQSLAFNPENGMKVLLRGEIRVYEPTGGYQMYIKEMMPDGIGELFIAFEQLKKKLEQEGLFERVHKKPIPLFPAKIGVITSPTGAAIRDIITTLKRRYPIGEILIFPALVQGKQAAPSVVKAIELANEHPIDVLIVGRGGGSIEELWAFNEEIVARAIYASKIPIISAVGHETDTTISDFVADLRAPTPTGAAEMAAPRVSDIAERISIMEAKLIRYSQQRIETEKNRLSAIHKSYAFKYPHLLYQQKLEQLDRVTERISRNSKLYFERRQDQLQALSKAVERNIPLNTISRKLREIEQIEGRMTRAAVQAVKSKQRDYLNTVTLLEAVSPLKIMEKGFGLVYKDEENLIKSTESVKIGDQLTVVVQDGEIDCTVNDIRESD